MSTPSSESEAPLSTRSSASGASSEDASVDVGYSVDVTESTGTAAESTAGTNETNETNETETEETAETAGTGESTDPSDPSREKRRLRVAVRLKWFKRYIRHIEKSGTCEGSFNALPLLDDRRKLFNTDKHDRNRYYNIVPYKDNCVTCEGRYINASAVELKCHSKYIATQGPMVNTIRDFWSMVLHHQCSMVVMLTKLVEAGVFKCAKYWPDLGSEHRHGNLRVKCLDEHRTSSVTTRRFAVRHKRSNKHLEVTQLHFTGWPDDGVPNNQCIGALGAATLQESLSTMLVHCSAGVGRTGTFIAAHALYAEIAAFIETGEGVLSSLFNVERAVVKLRTQRPFMVQTPEQFMAIHTMLALWATDLCGKDDK